MTQSQWYVDQPTVGQQELNEVLSTAKLLDLQKVYDSGTIGRCMPVANHRGDVGFVVGDYSSPPLYRVYVLDNDLTTPRLLADLYAFDPTMARPELPFMTSAGTVLVQAGKFRIYRITKSGTITKVFDVVTTGAYGYHCWAEDPQYVGVGSYGVIFAGYQDAPGGNTKIIKSTNDGQTWTEIYSGNHGAGSVAVMGATALNGKVFVLLSNGKILSGNDDGTGWAVVYDGNTDDVPTFSGEGMMVVDGVVYAAGSYYMMVCPNYLTPTVWIRVVLPFLTGWPNYKYDAWRTPRGGGRYLSVASVDGPQYTTTRHLVSADGFYTVSEAFRIPRGGNSSSGFYRVERYLDTMFIGHSGVESCVLFRGQIPPVLGDRIPLPRRVLRTDSLAALGTSASLLFEPALGKGLDITVEQTYNGAAAAGGQIELFSSREGVSWDTLRIEAARTLAFTAGATRRETWTPGDAAQRARYLYLLYTNLDAAQAITNIRAYVTVKG